MAGSPRLKMWTPSSKALLVLSTRNGASIAEGLKDDTWKTAAGFARTPLIRASQGQMRAQRQNRMAAQPRLKNVDAPGETAMISTARNRVPIAGGPKRAAGKQRPGPARTTLAHANPGENMRRKRKPMAMRPLVRVLRKRPPQAAQQAKPLAQVLGRSSKPMAAARCAPCRRMRIPALCPGLPWRKGLFAARGTEGSCPGESWRWQALPVAFGLASWPLLVEWLVSIAFSPLALGAVRPKILGL